MGLKNFDTFIFDLDGTLWKYPEICEGAEKIWKKLQDMNKNLVIVSNFTFVDRDEILKKLEKGGIKIEKEKLITSGYVAALLFKNKRVFPIGIGLKKELEKNGVIISDKKVDAVVIGHDTKFNYWKAAHALKLLREGAKLYVTSLGKIWNYKNDYLPGTGLIIKGIEYCSNKKAIMLGKPSKYIVNVTKKFLKGKVVHFGDEIKADSEFAKHIGAKFVFIRSGADKNVKKVKAYMILNSIKDIAKLL